MRVLSSSILLLSVAAGCAGVDDQQWDASDGELRAHMESAVSSSRAVRDPGFAFIDVDGDGRYEAGTDQYASLDASGSLVTPYSLVVPHDRRGPLLWDYGTISLDIGGDLILNGSMGCYSLCSTSTCPSSYTTNCSVDIAVGGDIETTNRAEIVSIARTGTADIRVSADGDIDFRGVHLLSSHQVSSGASDTIQIDALGSFDATSLDVDMQGVGTRTLEIAAGGELLRVARSQISADVIELDSCWSGVDGCDSTPVVDLRRFRVDSTSASLCLDGGDLDDAVDLALLTTNNTASNTCL